MSRAQAKPAPAVTLDRRTLEEWITDELLSFHYAAAEYGPESQFSRGLAEIVSKRIAGWVREVNPQAVTRPQEQQAALDLEPPAGAWRKLPA